jgi:RNA polymerase sigma-70 factor (ECF subfamily)
MTSTSDPSSTCPEATLESLYRDEWGRLLSLLVARTRRLDLAEDALGEAFARAAARWSGGSPPTNPVGWLYTTAHRQIIGRLRAEAIAGRKAPLLAVRPDWSPPLDGHEEMADDRLTIILLCCHPALPKASRSALALRLVIGTPTEQIARLFLVPTPTMAARLTRAKQKIATAGVPLSAPIEDELRTRLDEVCRTVYLAFTAGYTPGPGRDLLRADLAGDAVRLAGILHDQLPDAPQVRATHALLLLQHARRDARQRDGRLVTLPDQDRTLWQHDEIDRGLTLLDGFGPTSGLAEELRLQALIAAEHSRAPTAAATNWTTIAALYDELENRTGSPVVRLNRAVATAEAEGPGAGLRLLGGLEDALQDDHRLATVRAELEFRAGNAHAAREWFAAAIRLCANEVERSHLTARLEALDAGPISRAEPGQSDQAAGTSARPSDRSVP